MAKRLSLLARRSCGSSTVRWDCVPHRAYGMLASDRQSFGSHHRAYAYALRGDYIMEKIVTKSGDYVVYRGAEARRKPEEHEKAKWYYEPADYVGFTIFSDPHDTFEQARLAALECGEREEALKNEIGGGG